MENFKLYEPSMLDQENDEWILPTLHDLLLEYQEKLEEDIVLYKNPLTTRWG